MKRILYSCFLLTFLFLTTNVHSQVYNATVTPVMCSVPGGTTQGFGGVTVASAGGPTSYQWGITPPAGGGSTVTNVPGSVPPGSLVAITFSGCGNYQITVSAFNGPNFIQSVQLNALVECPTETVTASTPSVCPGAVSSLTATGNAVTWTWTPGGATTQTLNVNPLANTCYTVNGTTANGCTVQASSCITVQPIGATITPVSQTVCANTSITLTALTTPPSGPTFQWFNSTGPGPGVPLGTGSVQTATPSVPSNYSVLVSYNTCTAAAVIATVNIDINLSVQASAAVPAICPTQTTALTATASALSYTWLAPPGVPMPGNTASNTASFPGTYTVLAQNGACTGSTTVTVLLNTSFVPGVVASSAAVCPGETFTLIASGGANAATSYTWGMYFPPPAAPVPTLICFNCSATQTPVQFTTTSYVVGATSPQGCQGSNTITVNTSPPLNINASSSAVNGSVCASSPVTITATGAASYTFTGGVTSPSVNTTGILIENPVAQTIYTIIGSNAGGFCTSAPVTVTVGMISGGSLNITTAASVSSICPGQASNLSAFGALSYTWAPGGSLSSTVGANVVANPQVTTIYTITGDNNGGCSGTSTISLFVSQIPTVTINAFPNPVCAGFNSTITAFGASSYTWTGSTFSNPIFQPSIAVGSGNGGTGSTATYTVIGGSAGANCPSIPVTTTIVQAPPLNILAGPNNATTCIVSNSPKYSAAVTLTASGATTYAWFPYNPAYVTYSVGPSTTVRPPTTTCYTVTGSTQVCTGTAVVCVIVIPQFTMEVTPPQPAICIGDSIGLSIVNIQTTLAPGPASLYTYTWSPNVPITLTEDQYPNTIAFPQVTTTYTVEMGDSRGCRSLPRLVTVTVLPQPLTLVSLPIINNVPTNTVCFVGDIPSAPDNLITLCAANANPGGLPFGVSPTFSWVSPYNPTSIVTDPSFPCVTARAPSRLPAIAVYTVYSGYNGIPGCKRDDTVSVRVIDCRPVNNQNVVFTNDALGDTICSRNCITFMALTDTMAGNPQTYEWKFEGGNPSTSTEQNPVICYDLPGTWDVQLIVRNPYPLYESPSGSSGSTSKRDYMKVVDVPNVTIVPPGQRASDTTIKFGEHIVLTATNAIKYQWSPNYNISSLTNTRVTVNPFQSSQYIVTGYNSSRCFSSDTINVIVIEDCGEMFIPNAFSPNGDGVNDELKVRGICLETMTFMVFNRWGEKVFESADINVGWDGTYHGEKMNTGVFVYRLEGKTYSGKGFSLKGNATLIR